MPVALRILQICKYERVDLIHRKQALSLAGRECTRCARAVPFGPVSNLTFSKPTLNLYILYPVIYCKLREYFRK